MIVIVWCVGLGRTCIEMFVVTNCKINSLLSAFADLIPYACIIIVYSVMIVKLLKLRMNDPTAIPLQVGAIECVPRNLIVRVCKFSQQNVTNFVF